MRKTQIRSGMVLLTATLLLVAAHEAPAMDYKSNATMPRSKAMQRKPIGPAYALDIRGNILRQTTMPADATVVPACPVIQPVATRSSAPPRAHAFAVIGPRIEQPTIMVLEPHMSNGGRLGFNISMETRTGGHVPLHKLRPGRYSNGLSADQPEVRQSVVNAAIGAQRLLSPLSQAANAN